MNNTITVLGGLLISAGLVIGCGDSGNLGGNGGQGGENNGGTPSTGGTPNVGGGGGEGGTGGTPFVIPPKPELGAQLDRMGRPAVNTALDGAFVEFNGAGNLAPSNDADRAQLEDDYNADTDENSWGDTYTNLFAANLAVLDSLDSGIGGLDEVTSCENGAGSCGNADTPGCYDTLAGALADDRLWLRVDGTGCSSSPADFPTGYLAVELDFLATAGLAPPELNNDGCGGRRPIDDVIDITYTLVATGGTVPFGDAVDAPAGLHPETFPYLAPPH